MDETDNLPIWASPDSLGDIFATTLMHYLEDTICPRVALEAMVRGAAPA